jgi:hypothetical protein
VGKVVQSLQSVNYHDSCAHSHEQHEPFLFESSWSGSGYAAGVKPVGMVWLQVGCLWAWFGYGFDYRCDSFELEALNYRG